MSRNSLSEVSLVIATSETGTFINGDSVTITLYNNGSGSAEAVSTAVCTQISTSGIFFWAFSNLTNAPTAYADYKWVMTDGVSKFASGNQIFGGFIENIASVSGANSVTISVEETDTTPIASTEVQILNAAQDTVLDRKLTDVNGDAVFALDDASYKVRLFKSQVTFTVPEDLVVSGTTVDTFNGSPLVVASVAGAGECEITMNVSSQRPTIALSELDGTAQIKALPTLLSGIYFSGQKINGTFDSTNKRMFFVLPQLAVVEFSISEVLGTTKVSKLIPATSTANFQDLEAR